MMQAIWCLLTMALACQAHYYGGYSRNQIERDEPAFLDSVEMRDKLWRLPVPEECREGDGVSKSGKECRFGAYYNEVCGRKECYSGPDEECSEKMEYANFGKKCAYGYECSKKLGTCVGFGSKVVVPPLPQGWYQLLQRRRLAD